MKLSAPIYRLKRQAKLMARANNIKLHIALNQIAAKEGFKDWSHLASTFDAATPAKSVMERIAPGDLVLIAARPGHGKTLLGLELAALAAHSNRSSYVFTLDYNEQDVWDRFSELGHHPKNFDRPVVVDTSDAISADHIIKRLGNQPKDAFIVVDYLQLLDQKRSNPPLNEQIRALKTFAKDRDATVVLISQIDRAFELSSRDLPSMEDIRLPNPVDPRLFDKRCFLHDGKVQIEMAA